MNANRHPMRRHLLQRGAALAIAGAWPAWPGRAGATVAPREARVLRLVHTHTQERVEIAYAVGDRYVDPALEVLNRFLRDHYSGEVGVIDPGVLDLLHGVGVLLGREPTFEVISGFRGAATNERLRETRGGGVARHSLHLEGRALDVRLPGVALADLRDAALSLRGGGVGFYAQERFVHLDNGRVRRW